MKLRLQGSSLRLRLTRGEVERLLGEGEVSEIVPFRSGAALSYCVRKSAVAAAVQADLGQGAIAVSVPAAMAEEWAVSSEAGMYARDGELRISIEKDFRCLTRADEEQEPDAFPHPAGNCAA